MRLITIIAAAAAAVAATPAKADPVTYSLEYARIAGPAGSASATMVIDDALLLNGGIASRVSRSTADGFDELSSFELTIVGTGFVDGIYTLEDLTIRFDFDAPLDPGQELLAQETAIGPGGDFYFNLNDGGLIFDVDVNTFEAVIRDERGAVLEQARFRLTAVTPIQAAPDTDGDTVTDDLDNCIDVVNAAQTDADNDGFGNACDADFTQDCLVNIGDLAVLKASFMTADAVTDLNGDGQTNFADLAAFRAYFSGVPGPSGLATACD